MRRVRFFVWHLACLSFLLRYKSLYTSVAAEETGYEYSRGCSYLRCENGGQCIKRRFWCKSPPCPGMLYCSKSRKESLKGPLTCDTVRCSKGYACTVKVRGCRWDEKCEQQIARCVSEREYYDGAASCADFECSTGKRCVLRELYCINPPCKLLRSCADAKDAQIWFDECRALGCSSEHECFLRRPDNNCRDPSCTHTPDCTLTAEEELISKYCRGWICPRAQKCVVRIVGTCKGYNCTVERSCRESRVVPTTTSAARSFTNDQVAEQTPAEKILMEIETGLVHQEPERRGTSARTGYPLARKKPTTAATWSTGEQSTRYATSREHGTEAPVIRQRVSTRPITKLLESSSNGPYLTLPYPPSWLNYDKLSTTETMGSGLRTAYEDEAHEITSKFSDWSENSSFPPIPHADRKIVPATSRDTERLEMLKRIYVATDDALPLPVVLEGVNFVGQYPIWWIRDEAPRPLGPLGAKNENGSGWWYHGPREPHRILLPPYEPVILVEDAGQFLPFLALDRSFNDAALTPLPEITSAEATGNSKTNNIPTTVSGKIDNYVNSARLVEGENLNHFDDSSDYYANFSAMDEANQVLPNIRDKEDSERRSSYVNREYLEKSEPPLVHEQEFKPSVDDFATDDLNRSDTPADVGTPVKGQITDENRDGAYETRHALGHNRSVATFDPSRAPISMGQNDYDFREEEHYGLVNYPRDTTIARDVDESRREYRGSFRNEISDVARSDEENQPAVPTGFSLDESDESRYETTPYRRARNDDNRRNDEREYDDRGSSHESYDSV